MRAIHDHQATPADDLINIRAADEPGAGGAHHYYVIDLDGNNSSEVFFQSGPVSANGPNGITQETLIAIAMDRLRCFQAGPYSCRENAIALTKLEEAMHWLHHRTRARQRRGVEGTMTV